jgi:hypothetical protein
MIMIIMIIIQMEINLFLVIITKEINYQKKKQKPLQILMKKIIIIKIIIIQKSPN